MLVPATNNHEVTAEIKKDLKVIMATTFDRLFSEYDKERRKFKIRRDKTYPKNWKRIKKAPIALHFAA
jgi:predicted Rossmann fold nucleotide-binding protein DprA/Smf involved in DNA uptake